MLPSSALFTVASFPLIPSAKWFSNFPSLNNLFGKSYFFGILFNHLDFYILGNIYVGTKPGYMGTFPRKEGGIKVLAGLVPSSQTAGSLFRTPWLANLARKMICLKCTTFYTESTMHICWLPNNTITIISEWFHMGNCTSANVFFVAGKPIIFGHPGVNVIELFFLQN
jgi:hypothetical protein